MSIRVIFGGLSALLDLAAVSLFVGFVLLLAAAFS